MNINRKIFVKVIILTLLILIATFSAYTVKAEPVSLTDMESKANTFLEKGSKAAESIDTSALTDNFIELGKILTLIGAGVLVAVTTYMGIKYLTAGPEAQAKLKVQLIGVVVSGIVIFGAYGIWKIVIRIASKF